MRFRLSVGDDVRGVPRYTSNFMCTYGRSKPLPYRANIVEIFSLPHSSNIFISSVHYSKSLFTAIQIKDLKDYHSANIFISYVYYRKPSFNTSSTTMVVPLLQSSNIFISSVHYSKPLFTAIQICDLKDYSGRKGDHRGGGRSPRDSKANSYFMATHSPPPLRFSPLIVQTSLYPSLFTVNLYLQQFKSRI